MKKSVAYALALALGALAPNALAQQEPAAPERDEDLVAPELPTAPPELAPAVAALRETVEGTSECYRAGGRMEHEPDPRCPQWYARIARSGAAGAFAIGELFRPVATENSERPVEPIRSFESEFGRGPRLIQLLVATRRPEAATYLVSYLVNTATRPDGYASDTDIAALAGLRALTGDDAAPTAPWDDDRAFLETVAGREELARSWSRWLRERRGATPAQWRAAGAERAERWLSSDNDLERYSAIRRLAAVPQRRAAVTASLHALLSRDDLPAAARVHLTRLARQRGIPLPPRPLLARAAAVRPQ